VNHFSSARYDESAQRLALGLELVDPGRQARVAQPVSIAFDGIPWPLPPHGTPPRVAGGFELHDVLDRVDRHASGLHALVYRRGLYRKPPPGDVAVVTLRFLSPQRWFVPRRLRFPLLDPAPIEALDEAAPDASDPDLLGLPSRVRDVTLWPGAAYGVGRATTGLRGRVRSRTTGRPVRWARVVAFASDANGEPDLGAEVGRAHGDDRGEFLLLLGPDAGGIGPFDGTLSVTAHVFVFADATVPVPTPAQLASDPLWDVPLERVTTPFRTDEVLRGEQLPPGFTLHDSQKLTFELGRFLTSEVPPFTP
jgi:hypothetical protein